MEDNTARYPRERARAAVEAALTDLAARGPALLTLLASGPAALAGWLATAKTACWRRRSQRR